MLRSKGLNQNQNEIRSADRQGKLLLKTIKKSMKVQTSKLPEVQGKMFD